MQTPIHTLRPAMLAEAGEREEKGTMQARTRPQRVATLVMSSLVALATLVLPAMPAGAILGADMTIASSASSDPVEVGERLVYTIDVENAPRTPRT